VLNGFLGEAIELTYQLFPGILERNSNLLFALKVRQFIEMINTATRATPEGGSTTDSKETPGQNGFLNTQTFQQTNSAMIVDSANDETKSLKNGFGEENDYENYMKNHSNTLMSHEEQMGK
jgi:hypothetical protein